MKNLCGLLLAFMLCGLASAQTSQIPPNSGDRTFNSVFFPVYSLNAAPLSGASIAVVGQPGQATWCYWAVSNFQIGSVMSSLGCVQNAANTLSSSNYVSILPYSYPPSVASIDILATTSFSAPTGACVCAVATGLTSGGTNQQSNTTSAYTVSLLNPQAFNLVLRNEVVGSAAAHLLLRNAYTGALISDLSNIGSGSVTGTGTANRLPVWTGSSAIGNSTIQDVSGSYILGGKIIAYNGVNDFANGVETIVGVSVGTNLTTNQGNTATPNSNLAAAGTYKLVCYLVVVQAASSSSTLPACQVNYTDRDTGTAETITFAPTNTANTVGATNISNSAGNSTYVSIQANSTIGWSTTGFASSGATPMLYNAHVYTEWIGP